MKCVFGSSSLAAESVYTRAEHELAQLVDNLEHFRAHADRDAVADGVLPRVPVAEWRRAS